MEQQLYVYLLSVLTIERYTNRWWHLHTYLINIYLGKKKSSSAELFRGDGRNPYVMDIVILRNNLFLVLKREKKIHD